MPFPVTKFQKLGENTSVFFISKFSLILIFSDKTLKGRFDKHSRSKNNG